MHLVLAHWSWCTSGAGSPHFISHLVKAGESLCLRRVAETKLPGLSPCDKLSCTMQSLGFVDARFVLRHLRGCLGVPRGQVSCRASDSSTFPELPLGSQGELPKGSIKCSMELLSPSHLSLCNQHSNRKRRTCRSKRSQCDQCRLQSILVSPCQKSDNQD